jgi:acetylornithine deacetylase/succinyl-diaminopimelate desuccinylase-like protein
VARRPLLERVIRELASFERPSASEGERRAAEWIAAELREAGCRDVRVEEERAHGGYWWPLGLLNLGAFLASLLGGRRAAALAGAAAATAVYDDVGGGRLWFRRAALPKRPTWNVLAEAGDPGARRTIVFIAHHDAAHSGLVFHPALPRIGMKLAPKLHERAEQSVPILYGTFLGPLLLALWGLLGSKALRTAGTVLTLGTGAAMANIGASRVVPGANDNLSAVAVVVALAHSLREDAPEGVRVLLLSTGSEESFMEGMQAFAKRHFPSLARETTEFVCLECVGSPELCVVEGEGMLRMRYYTGETRERLARAGPDAGVEVTRGLRTVAATDALIALRAGYPTCLLGGVDESRFPANYHWPSDTADNLDWDSVEGALKVCEEFVRGRAAPARG